MSDPCIITVAITGSVARKSHNPAVPETVAEQIKVDRWRIELGGHIRTGLEDNIRLDANTLAPSNAALVRKAADLYTDYGRHPASTEAARSILGLDTPS